MKPVKRIGITGLAWILQDPAERDGVTAVFFGPRQMNELVMNDAPRERVGRHDEILSKHFNDRLRVIAMQSVTYWFSHDRLDKLLAQYIGCLENCELLYAIDTTGRQISSNIYPRSMDTSAYGQDLSRRPYAVNLSVLGNIASNGAFSCGTYLSRATERPCVTVMYGVTSGSSFMGFIAADFYPTDQ